MTLGRFISELEILPQYGEIENIYSPHSYRGRHSDLAFLRERGTIPIYGLIELLKDECLGQTFPGYKGGAFQMDENTPLWIADYGCSGVKIVGIAAKDCPISLMTQEEDD